MIHPPSRILIVDDDDDLLLITESVLEPLGFEICTTNRASQALQILAKQHFDLVVSDLQMPGVDGQELLEVMRARGDKTAVLFLSGTGSVPDIVKLMKSGAISFLQKPVDSRALKHEVVAALAEIRTRRGHEETHLHDAPATSSPSPSRAVASALAGKLPPDEEAPVSQPSPVSRASTRFVPVDPDSQDSRVRDGSMRTPSSLELSLDIEDFKSRVQPPPPPPFLPAQRPGSESDLPREPSVEPRDASRVELPPTVPPPRGSSSRVVTDTPPTPSMPLGKLAGGLPGGPPSNPTVRSLDGMAGSTPGRIGRYTVCETLAAGGMGKVYRAHDPNLDRQVALKVILAPTYAKERSEFITRFRREAKALAKLRHPHIVAVHDADVDPTTDTPYLVMELIDGPSLGDLLDAGPLRPAQALAFAQQLAEALAFAHQHGIVHRDIKPENVIVDVNDQLHLIDFGVARTDDSDVTSAYILVGTPSYLSPEAASGEPVDWRADQFSLATLIVQMLTGQRIFRGEGIADTVRRVCTAVAPTLAELGMTDVPAGLQELLSKMHSKEPDERIQDEQELLSGLRAAHEQLVT